MTFKCSTISELRQAIRKAKDGDRIKMAPGHYTLKAALKLPNRKIVIDCSGCLMTGPGLQYE
jgi:hypothetical protein